MGSIARIRNMIEAELRKSLAFEIGVVENRTSPGAAGLQRGDLVLLRLWVSNTADVTFRRVAGLLTPTLLCSFKPTRFETLDLQPGVRRPVADLFARIEYRPSGDPTQDGLAQLTVLANARLPEVEIRDVEHHLRYVDCDDLEGRRHGRLPALPVSELDAPGL